MRSHIMRSFGKASVSSTSLDWRSEDALTEDTEDGGWKKRERERERERERKI